LGPRTTARLTDAAPVRHSAVDTMRISAVIVAVLLGGGCGSSSVVYVKTMVSLQGKGPSTPSVYLRSLPPFPFRSVGTIEVRGTIEPDEMVEKAVEAGAKLGCEAIIDNELVVTKTARRTGSDHGLRLAQYRPMSPPPVMPTPFRPPPAPYIVPPSRPVKPLFKPVPVYAPPAIGPVPPADSLPGRLFICGMRAPDEGAPAVGIGFR
jgi:hypothetical protein